MELKPNYTKTEVGQVPDAWQVMRLRSIGQFLKGSGVTRNEAKDGTLPCVRYGEIYTTHEIYIREFHSWITPEIAKSATRLQRGDLLFAASGETKEEIGKCVAFLRNEEAYAGGDIVILRSSGVDPIFLGFALNTSSVNKQKASLGQGDAVVHISAKALASISLPIPPSLEQSAIATALSDADGLIESLEALVAKKRLIKQGAMQELLSGKRRLPGFSGEWEVKRLGEFGNCYRGVTYDPRTDLTLGPGPETISLLRSNNIQGGKLRSTEVQHVKNYRVSTVQRLRKYDILICMANGSRDLVGKSGQFVTSDAEPYTFGAFIGCFRPDAEVESPAFLFYLFQTENYRAQIDLLLAGSSINNLSPASVESLHVTVPRDSLEQTAIASVLSDMDAELDVLTAKLTKAREVKQGMMQELLTGRIRLVTPIQRNSVTTASAVTA